MSRPNPAALFAFLLALLVALGGAAVLKGGLYIGKHEGDTLHLMQIVFRMAEGQVPHLDFMTPIGALAFWPITLLVKAGFGIGAAIIWAQVILAALFLPIILWVAASRLGQGTAFLFGLFVMVLLLALVHGEAQRSVSISMHYNRLAWAAAFVAIIAALIPPTHPKSGTVDGIIIGLMAIVMVMIKVTYFVSFAVPIIVALLLTEQRRALSVALVTGLAGAGLITLFTGSDYWLAYLNDLRTVAGSEVRSAPGEPLGAIMGAPAYLGGSLAAVAGVIFLRQARVEVGGLVLLLLLPGFFYVTYQNFGNDPQWLLLLAVILLALRPGSEQVARNGFGWPLRDAIGITAAMALAFAAPSFFNLAYSPFRHLAVDTSGYLPILPRSETHSDLQAIDIRVARMDARIALDQREGAGLDAYAEAARRDEDASFMGEVFPFCTIELGLPAMMEAIVLDMEAEGLAGADKAVFAADIFSSYWLFGDLRPMAGGAPWYYGGLPGYADADYLLIPLCPVAQDVQVRILKAIEEAGTEDLTEVRRTANYILFQKVR